MQSCTAVLRGRILNQNVDVFGQPLPPFAVFLLGLLALAVVRNIAQRVIGLKGLARLGNLSLTVVRVVFATVWVSIALVLFLDNGSEKIGGLMLLAATAWGAIYYWEHSGRRDPTSSETRNTPETTMTAPRDVHLH